ncbi:unnamed protein product [Prorocentrum cordatum]|uniref:SUI1 domain-containing protein n=1 Tax=Prorocentrum cordatum TaxID=2364126 RepID=A0ABN9U670_9DINO|nr:unnamed protein product [Polarella glacialis]
MASVSEKFDASGGFSGKDDGRAKVHIRMQQRNGRKSWTTVQGFPEQVRLPKTGRVLPVNFEKILQHLKKTFKTNGTLIYDAEHGTIIQLQGDIRKEVAEFLVVATALISKDQDVPASGGVRVRRVLGEGLHTAVPCTTRPNEALYAARIDGLQADARYRFVLAAANGVGTGRWSGPSSLVQTPVGAPAPPANAVATVALDSNQRVAVNVTWDCGPGCVGSGAVDRFVVRLARQQQLGAAAAAASGSCSSNDAVLSEQVRVPSAVAGRRVSWSKALTRPGHYVVEVVAENTVGQQSPPASLALEVRPETFPPELQELPPDMPHWAEEPVLVLGARGRAQAESATIEVNSFKQWRSVLACLQAHRRMF